MGVVSPLNLVSTPPPACVTALFVSCLGWLDLVLFFCLSFLVVASWFLSPILERVRAHQNWRGAGHGGHICLSSSLGAEAGGL